jgi:hypothetical protein
VHQAPEDTVRRSRPGDSPILADASSWNDIGVDGCLPGYKYCHCEEASVKEAIYNKGRNIR